MRVTPPERKRVGEGAGPRGRGHDRQGDQHPETRADPSGTNPQDVTNLTPRVIVSATQRTSHNAGLLNALTPRQFTSTCRSQRVYPSGLPSVLPSLSPNSLRLHEAPLFVWQFRPPYSWIGGNL